MLEYRLPNAAAHTLTISNASKTLEELIRTASGDATYVIPTTADAIEINIESNDLRVLSDTNTPTASAGMILKAGMYITMAGRNLKQMRFIRAAGSDCVFSIALGQTT